MRNYLPLILFIFPVALLMGCREKVEEADRAKMEKEHLGWAMKIHKMEMKATEHQFVMNELLDSIETWPAVVRDSVRGKAREWNAAFNIVSDRMDEFMDENESWLKKLGEEGMAKDVSESWWKNRRSQFNEMEEEVKGLEILFDDFFHADPE